MTSSTTLTPNHLAELAASCIDTQLAQLNCISLDGDPAITRFLADVDTAGFTDRTQLDAQWRALRKRSQIQAIERGALFFEGIDPLTGDPLAWVRCKPVQPRRSHRDGKVVKYETPPKQPLRVSFFRVTPEIWQAIADRYSVPMPTDGTTFWQWVQINPEIELIITEGEKKALALLSAGYVAVSVPGINCGYRKNVDGTRSLHPDLLPFANRRIVIAYDQDEKQSTRLKVDGAIVTTARLLAEAGAIAQVARWDGLIGKGIDDYIAAGGNLDDVIEQASSPPKLALYFARKRAASRLGEYRPDLKVCVPCLSAIAPESIPSTGIVAIIGNTGTGKTKLLKAIAEGLDGVIAPNPRITVGRGLSETIGLTYLQDADRGNGYFVDANGQPTRRIGLCWDSLLGIPLWLYPDGSFDLILDEADQGLSHLISGGTCGKDGKRPALIARQIELIIRARRVILASATLTLHELNLIAALRGETPWILQNTYQANSYPITLFTGERGVKLSSSKARGMVTDAITTSLKAGESIVVAADQILIAKMIEVLGMQAGLLPHQILRFDREMSGEDWQREFADRPDEFLDRHDIRLLVHSPSLTSGVSIEGDHFDRVFGIFEGQTISPDDALQSLARVRKSIPRVVYVNHYGVSSGVIDATRQGDYLAQSDRRAKMIAHVSGAAITPSINDPNSIYHAATQADRNASMATFGASLQALLEAAGNAVTIGTAGESPQAIALWRSLRRDVLEADCWAKFCSDIIDGNEASDLRAKRNLKHSDALKLDRYDLCEWYAVDHEALTIEDIQYDRRGRTRRELSRLEELLLENLSRLKDSADLKRLTHHNAPIQAHDLPGRELASKTAIALGIPELIQRCITENWHAGTDWVKDFATKVRQYADDVRLAIGFNLHKRMTDCQVVGMVLKHYGFSTSSRRMGNEGNRVRVYQLNSDSLSFIKSTLQRRAKRHMENGLKLRPDSLIPLLLGGIDGSSPHPHKSAATEADAIPIQANAPPNSV